MLMKEALQVFGTKRRLSEVLGLAYQSVKGWGDQIPDNRQQHVRLAINAYKNQPSTMSPQYVGWSKFERNKEYARLKREWTDENGHDEGAYNQYITLISRDLGI